MIKSGQYYLMGDYLLEILSRYRNRRAFENELYFKCKSFATGSIFEISEGTMKYMLNTKQLVRLNKEQTMVAMCLL
ncbi:Uncharacterised protein [uncultured archaeon]|nr:Uncharacterised protein [uncultured archaeon]